MTDNQRLAARARQLATEAVGVRESGGRNRGPEVDRYLRRGGGLDPEGHAYPWCVAFLMCRYADAAEELGVPCPLPVAASVGQLWTKANRFFTRIPMPDSIAMHLSDPKNPFSPGHVGLVLSISDGEIHTVEGNTNAEGSREGDCVAVKIRPLAFWNFGFIDITTTREK